MMNSLRKKQKQANVKTENSKLGTILIGSSRRNHMAELIYRLYTAQEKLGYTVEKMMKGSYIEAHEKIAKLFNQWEKFNSTEGESIESYYHHFINLMNDFYKNKHLKKIATGSLGLAACASLESKNEVCLLCEVNPKQIPAFDFICASLESILAIEDTWERERSGFAEEKVWGDIPVVTGFWGGK
ncbi:hypothetical protein Tco_0289400 [Tanacetum coccineum]